jgi:hypothetical protein
VLTFSETYATVLPWQEFYETLVSQGVQVAVYHAFGLDADTEGNFTQ